MPAEALTDRQVVALTALGLLGDAVPAFVVGDALVAAGLQDRQADQARGAANTLAALRRRGLAAFERSGGVFISADWKITDEGRRALEEHHARAR